MPRSLSAATMSATGNTSPVGLVTWLISASRVRSVAAATMASVTSSAIPDGQSDIGDDDARAGALGDEPHGVETRRCTRDRSSGSRRRGRVRRRPQDSVDAGGGIGHERKIVGLRADEFG